jgi:hypothetical protein
MKTVDIHETNLDACVVDAQSDRVVIMRSGNPVAIVVGVQGLDEEQAQLGASDEFWKLISERRKESTLDRSALEKKFKD